MSLALLLFGAPLVFWSAVLVSVGLPAWTMQDAPSEIWRPRTEAEQAGHDLYVQNGCSYCHTLFVRTFDWGLGSERISRAGDYHQYRPAILGTERTGPDLQQEGGEHPDDWHLAHFINPRYTNPESLMPSWEFLGREKIDLLTAYVQSLGGKMADARMARQRYWKKRAVTAYEAGPEVNIRWLHAWVPEPWRAMPNPYPAAAHMIQQGHAVYQDFCTGCHGAMGDGQGPAVKHTYPPPLNFTTLRRHLVDGKYIGGILYYQVMNGVTGTAMPYFKRALESDKIWSVSNYVALYFIGYTDADIEPEGIDAAYEPPYRNPYETPPRELGPVRRVPRRSNILEDPVAPATQPDRRSPEESTEESAEEAAGEQPAAKQTEQGKQIETEDTAQGVRAPAADGAGRDRTGARSEEAREENQ
jgi:cbb3-type cytochrome c oxidase subunit II